MFWPAKGDRHRLCEAPGGPFRQTEPVPVFALGGDGGMRPAFLGHLLVELLLDATLIADDPARLTQYYHLLDDLDAGQIEAAVNRMAPRPTRRLAWFIELFRRERVLWDYLEDDTLMRRLGQVMRRVRLDPLPDRLAAVLPPARKMVAERRDALLDDIPALASTIRCETANGRHHGTNSHKNMSAYR